MQHAVADRRVGPLVQILGRLLIGHVQGQFTARFLDIHLFDMVGQPQRFIQRIETMPTGSTIEIGALHRHCTDRTGTRRTRFERATTLRTVGARLMQIGRIPPFHIRLHDRATQPAPLGAHRFGQCKQRRQVLG